MGTVPVTVFEPSVCHSQGLQNVQPNIVLIGHVGIEVWHQTVSQQCKTQVTAVDNDYTSYR